MKKVPAWNLIPGWSFSGVGAILGMHFIVQTPRNFVVAATWCNYQLGREKVPGIIRKGGASSSVVLFSVIPFHYVESICINKVQFAKEQWTNASWRVLGPREFEEDRRDGQWLFFRIMQLAKFVELAGTLGAASSNAFQEPTDTGGNSSNFRRTRRID